MSLFTFFEKLTSPFPDVDINPPPRGITAFCRHYSKGMELPLLVMATLTATVAILEVTLFSFIGELVDLLNTTQPDDFFSKHRQQLIGMALIVLLALPATAFLHSLLMHQSLLGNYPMSVRWQSHRYLLKQSLNFFQEDFAGRLATKVMQTSLAVRETVMKLLDVLTYVAVYFGAVVFLALQLSYWLALPFICWLTAYLCIQRYFLPKLKHVATEQANSRAKMTGRVVDSYTNIATVKLFAHTRQETDYAKTSMWEFLQSVYKQMRLATGINIAIHSINYLLIFTIGGLSIYLWQQNMASTGDIAIATGLSLRLASMSQWVIWEISGLFENIGTVSDGINTLCRPLEVTDIDNASALQINQGKIAIDNIHFHYPKSKQAIFKDFSLQLEPGEKIGLVGCSGAGKSSLVNLLLRFYDLNSGKILIDGQDISQLDQESLRSHIGMVTQDTSLLHRSIRDNILYGSDNASEAEMIAAAKQAEAHDFIQGLSDPYGNQGYDVQVGERGVKLSGGQRQRIAIARVLLKNAPILILDEATSALDSETEAAIQHSLEKLMQNKTVIAIAHRLSTIAAMDRLVVLDQGRIVEQGTHQQLLAAKGIYASLWQRQTGGFLALDIDN